MALEEKVNEQDLRNYLQGLLQVSPEASERQLKRARDRQLKRFKKDYLSENKDQSIIAKQKIDKIHQAYDCLSSQKTFVNYLNQLNNLILTGQSTKEELLVLDDFLNLESERPVLTLVDDVPVITPIVEDSNVIAGPSPGTPIPVSTVKRNTRSNGTPFVNKEEEERLASLKEKQVEKEKQQEKSKANRLASLEKKTLKSIEDAAIKEAEKTAKLIKAKGKPDPDSFYDQVFEATMSKVGKVKDEQIAKMKRMDLPVSQSTLTSFENACNKKAEEATQDEYFKLKEEGPLKKRVNSPIYLIVTVLASVAVFLFFINFAATMWTNLPDPTADQFKPKKVTNNPDKAPDPASVVTPISSNLEIASGKGLARVAGVAGMAGFATTLDIAGSSDYNSALHSAYRRDYDSAIKKFGVSLSKNSNLYQTKYNLASVYFWKNKPNLAIKIYTESSKLRPDLAQANYNRGVIFLNEAINLTRQIKKDSTPHKDIEERLKKASKLVHASAKEFNITTKKAPAMAQGFYNRAIARYIMEDYAGAKEDFVEALRLNNNLDAAKYNMVIAANMLSKEKASVLEEIPQAPEGPQGPPGPGYL